jgi:ParB-like chromosome segregation protein Spo0J
MPAGPLTDHAVHEISLPEIRLYPGNARRGDIEKIAKSLRTNGQYRPIIVRRETSEILAGNHTYQAAQLLGWDTILVTYLDGLTDAQARKIVLVDNKTNDAAGYDDHALAQLLAELEGDHTGTGFEEDEIAGLLATLDPEPAANTDVDDIPEPPTYEPVTTLRSSLPRW